MGNNSKMEIGHKLCGLTVPLSILYGYMTFHFSKISVFLHNNPQKKNNTKKNPIIKLVEVMHGVELIYYKLSNGNEITTFPDQFLM